MSMRSKLTHLLLLMALTFNIAHASIIASQDHCHHENVGEYGLEQADRPEWHGLCDIHHLFHLTAIITPILSFLPATQFRETPKTELLAYHSPFKETENKPPIA